MRNLKKVLSLALALVMLLGMMVVGAGAATSFKDDADIKNQEAVAVLVGMGIMKGRVDDATKEVLFDPTGTLTRAEAAKMIAQLDLGVQAADALVGNGTSPFSDVWSGYWAEGAIDYCVEQGYINGDGAGHFLPNNKVSSVEFGIMLLRLLGYDAKVEGLVGDQWASKGAALARKAGLTTSVAANTQPMTRDAMAQMAFNALTATLVEYNGLNVSIGDATFNTPATPRYHNENDVTDQDTYDGKKPTATTTIKFCEEHFPDLKLDTGARDGFKREYSVWTWKRVDIAGSKQLVKADAEFTAKTTASAVSSAINGATGARLDTPVYVNGKQVTTIASTNVDADLIASWTQNGRQVLVYLNETNHKQIEKVVVVDTFVAQVNSVGSDSITLNILNDADQYTKEPANAAYSKLQNSDEVDVYSDKEHILAGSLTSRVVKTTGFTAGDLVTYTAAYNNDTKKYTIVADDVAVLTDPVTGTLTAWKGDGLINKNTIGNAKSSFTVDSGDPYEYSINNVVVDSDGGAINISDFAVNKSEINVYVDKYGYAIYVSGVEVTKNYAAVIGMGKSNQYGSETRGVTLLLPDNTRVEVTAKMDNWNVMTTQPSGEHAGENLVVDGLADIVTYTVDSKGIYTLTLVSRPRVSYVDYTGKYKVPTAGQEPEFVNGRSRMMIEGVDYYTTNRTIFMIGSQNSDNTYSYSVYTGYANAPSIVDETVVHGIAYGLNRTLSRQIDVVYIDASNLSNATGNEIYFAFNKNLKISTTSDGSFVTVPAVVDGKVEDIMISATISKDWDGSGEKELRNVTTNDLYVIDSVVRNDAGIITNCIVKDKGRGNDILKALPAGQQGVIKAGYGVIGFGQANDTDNFWAYTDSSKGYYIDEDYTTITETAIGSFATDKNDIVWANGDVANSTAKKVTTLFVVEVEGNEAPVGPSDNEVVVTVEIDAGVKSVTVGTTKLTQDGNVNVTKNTATDVTVELNDDYKVTGVTGAGNTWTSGEKFTIKTSTAGTLKIETASTKGQTLTLIGSTMLATNSSGANGMVYVFDSNGNEIPATMSSKLINGANTALANYNVPDGAKVTVLVKSTSTDITAGGKLFIVDGVEVTAVDTAKNNNNGDYLTFTMPSKDLTINMTNKDTFAAGEDGKTPDALYTVTTHGDIEGYWSTSSTATSGTALVKNGVTQVPNNAYVFISDVGKGQAVINAVSVNYGTANGTSIWDGSTRKSVQISSAGIELYSATKVTVASNTKATSTTPSVTVQSSQAKYVAVDTVLTLEKDSGSFTAFIYSDEAKVLHKAAADETMTVGGKKDLNVYGASLLTLEAGVKATYQTDVALAAGTYYVKSDENLTIAAVDATNEVPVEKTTENQWYGDAITANETVGTTGKTYMALTKVTLNAGTNSKIEVAANDGFGSLLTVGTQGAGDTGGKVFGIKDTTLIKVTGVNGDGQHIKVEGKAFGETGGECIKSETVGGTSSAAIATIEVGGTAITITQA